MNFRTVKTVIAREYLTKVKKKSFLLTTFLVPVIMAAAIVVMVLVMTKVGDRAQSVAVIDQSGIAMPYLVSDGANTYVDFSGEDPESFKNRLEEFDMDVLVVVSPMDSASKSVSVQAYSRKPLGVDFASSVGSKVDDAVEAYRISSYGIDNLGQIMKDGRSDVKVTEYTLDDSGKETVSESGIYMAVSMILGIFIFMFITMMAKGLQDVPLIKQISQVLGGAVGAAEAMIFVLVLSIAFNSPLFKNGETAVQNTLIANVNEISGKVYDKLLDPMMDADAFNRAYENAAEMTNEQRDNLRRWLEEKGYVSDVEGYTVVTEPAAEAETEEAETEGD